MTAKILKFPTHAKPLPEYDWASMDPDVAQIVAMLEAKITQAAMRRAKGEPPRDDIGDMLLDHVRR